MEEGWDEYDGGAVSRVQVLEEYCSDYGRLTLDGLQERIAGIPPDAVRGSDFLHDVCIDEKVTLEMIECLLDAFPDAARSIDSTAWSPLHYACANKSMDPEIVRLLLERWPESVDHQDNETGDLPLHNLCTAEDFDETSSLAILDLLVAAAPLSLTRANAEGRLPIHCASESGRSYPFCKRLIDACPESLWVVCDAMLPIHRACYYGGNNVEAVRCIADLCPESIDARARDGRGDLPIHSAVAARRESHKVEIIRYLLAKNPDCASKLGVRLPGGLGGHLPLHVACYGTCLESVHLLFDAYPQAIDVREVPGGSPLDIARDQAWENGNSGEIGDFLEEQLVYANLAKDSRAMHTPDENGWLPLHRALQDDACLGAIKLLVKGNPSALQVAGHNLAFPLHIACEFSTVDVVQHMLGLLDIHLHTVDLQRDSTLHYACRGGNLGVIKFLLERGVPSVSEPNSDGKLPVHFLWDSNRVDRDSVEYVDAVWRLLLSHPETVMH